MINFAGHVSPPSCGFPPLYKMHVASNATCPNYVDIPSQLRFLVIVPHSNTGNSPNLRQSPITTATLLGNCANAQRATSCTQCGPRCAKTNRTPVRSESSITWLSRLPTSSTICSSVLCSSPTSNQKSDSNPWIFPQASASGITFKPGMPTSLHPVQISAYDQAAFNHAGHIRAM